MMHLEKLFNWRRSSRFPDRSDPTTQSIDDAIVASASRLRSVDPETSEHWGRLKLAITRKENAAVMSNTIFKKGILRPAISIAIAMAILVVVGVIWFSRPSIKTYATTEGQHETIMLPDSTEVTLNHTSELTVSHSPLEKTRRVALKGEAFFDVRRNGLPFIVSTDIGTVRVLGTQFNVRIRDGQLEVGIVRGSVQVTISRNGADSSLILSKDQIVACTTTGLVEKPGLLPFADYPGWMHGRLMFYRTDLFSVCRELESQFDIVIKIQEPQLRAVSITGTIDGQNIETALTTLARLTGSNYRREDSSYVIY